MELTLEVEQATTVVPIPMCEQEGILVPEAPRDVAGTGLERMFLADLALKIAHGVPKCSTQWMAEQLGLPIPLTEDLLMGLKKDHFLNILGEEGVCNHSYSVTDRGHSRATHALAASAYLGPAPVRLDQYNAMMEWQKSTFPPVQFEDVRDALKDLVLSQEEVTIAAAAVVSGRSLFLFGPAGNGKTTIACALHRALSSELWIPSAIAVGEDAIQLFDPQCHQESKFRSPQPWKTDRRWVRIQRPLIVSGGEMTLNSLELARTSAGCYEAPLHVKANGGTFVIDDFGRQRADPWSLLNRWIFPLAHGFDYLTLDSGRKFRLPFQQLLIIATNIDPEKVMDPAFLRRMGYRLYLGAPTPERYHQIFAAAAHGRRVSVPPGLVDRLLNRYRKERRPMRGCEPGDLLSRVQDLCDLRRQSLQLNDELIDLAWAGYFGTSAKPQPIETGKVLAGSEHASTSC